MTRIKGVLLFLPKKLNFVAAARDNLPDFLIAHDFPSGFCLKISMASKLRKVLQLMQIDQVSKQLRESLQQIAGSTNSEDC